MRKTETYPACGPITPSIFSRSAIRSAAVAIVLLLPLAAIADPVQLKLAFFASEQSEVYRAGIKPFVDAVNAEAKGLLSIKVFPNGALGALAELPQRVLDGTTDIAWAVPGQTPYRFPDNEVLEMPGLFRDVREGSLVYTRLVASGALRGYDSFFVIGAFASAPSIIHSRKPIRSIADFRGLKIRTNNTMEAETLGRFGAIPTVMPASMLADALAKGTVDAAVVSPTGLFQFGAAGSAKNHFLLAIGTAPLLVVMNRQRFEQLPDSVKALIRKYSGDQAATTWNKFFGASERASLDKIKSDPTRTAVEPSPADRKTAQDIYAALLQGWAAKAPRNARILAAIEAQLATIRSEKQ